MTMSSKPSPIRSITLFPLFPLMLGTVVGLSACAGDRHLVGEGTPSQSGGGSDAAAAEVRPSSAADGPPTDARQVSPSGDAAAATPGSAVVPTARALVISGREVVRRLSVVLWNQPDDAVLAAEADAGKFRTTGDVHALALRMLGDARARAGVGGFYRWWLKQNELVSREQDSLPPVLTPEMRADMAREVELLGIHVTLDVDERLPTLYTAPYSFINARLASIYGLPGIVGNEHRKVALDPMARAGILTLPGVLAQTPLETRTSSPTVRGKFIGDQFLCTQVPPSANSSDFSTAPPTANQTARQWIVQATAQPQCAACHSLWDPQGFALDGFDVIGRSRTHDDRMLPVDTRAEVSGGIGLMAGPVDGPVALAKKIAESTQAHSCFAEHWMVFALGRPVTDADRPALRALDAEHARVGLNIQQMIAVVMQSDLFLAPETAR